MAHFQGDGAHRVAVLVRPGVMPMELGIVHELLSRAESSAGDRLYQVVTCAPSRGHITTNADFTIHVEHGPEILPHAQTVIIPAATGDGTEDAPAELDPSLAAALAAIRPDARIASVCTGAFVLAAAGFLDGRRATTHWYSAARFRDLYPNVDLDPNVLYTDDAAVLTSAGEAAGIDMCLHIIRSDHGAAVANNVARMVVVPPHRDGGQAQYIENPVPAPTTSSTADARAWALTNLEHRISLRDLADQERVSVRTFTRRFRAEVGLTPGRWLTQQRVERARQLLEQTDHPIDRIADDCGFGTTASLRQHLHEALGVSPSAYRATFQVVPARRADHH